MRSLKYCHRDESPGAVSGEHHRLLSAVEAVEPPQTLLGSPVSPIKRRAIVLRPGGLAPTESPGRVKILPQSRARRAFRVGCAVGFRCSRQRVDCAGPSRRFAMRRQSRGVEGRCRQVHRPESGPSGDRSPYAWRQAVCPAHHPRSGASSALTRNDNVSVRSAILERTS